LISKVLNFALDREWVPANVAHRLPKPKDTKRRRVLSPDEVRALWQWLDTAPPAALMRDADAARRWRLNRAVLKLRLVTTARGNEIIGMRWKDLDWNTRDHGPWWTMPITKNGHPHRLPLTKPAIAVLRDLERRADNVAPDAYVFAGIRGKRQRRGVLTADKFPIPDFLPRDLRRTATTNLASLGVDRFTVQRILNHSDPDVTADYDLYAYGPEKRAALDKWAGRLAEYTRAARLVKGRRA
jgi:integrase